MTAARATVSTVSIRECDAADADALAALSGQLGYPSTTAQVAARFVALATRPDWGAYVAELDERIAGSVFVHAVFSLQRDPCAEIGGLIVDEDHRNRRIGEALVAAAEDWARQGGYTEMIVHSNVSRLDAHRFYQRLGYTTPKAQQYFHKELAR